MSAAQPTVRHQLLAATANWSQAIAAVDPIAVLYFKADNILTSAHRRTAVIPVQLYRHCHPFLPNASPFFPFPGQVFSFQLSEGNQQAAFRKLRLLQNNVLVSLTEFGLHGANVAFPQCNGSAALSTAWHPLRQWLHAGVGVGEYHHGEAVTVGLALVNIALSTGFKYIDVIGSSQLEWQANVNGFSRVQVSGNAV